MNPHDKNDCPICKGEIRGKVLISNRIKPREEFYCPGCRSVLTYSVIEQYPGTKLLLHYEGDPKKLYGESAQYMGAYTDKRPPVRLVKPVEVISAKAYLTKEMETRGGKILPENSLVTILNVNKKGDDTEVVFEGAGMSSLPTVLVPKRNLLLAIEEIDSSPERIVWAIDTWATNKLADIARANAPV